MLHATFRHAYMTTYLTCPHMTFDTSTGGCCFFNKRKGRNSAFVSWLRLASPDLEAVLHRSSRHLRKSRLMITGAPMDAAYCETINCDYFHAQTTYLHVYDERVCHIYLKCNVNKLDNSNVRMRYNMLQIVISVCIKRFNLLDHSVCALSVLIVISVCIWSIVVHAT